MSDIQDAIGVAMREATEAHAADELANEGIVFRDWGEFMANEPPEFDWIIPGVIAKGMKGDGNGKAKERKSFFANQLVLCVSTGTPFLGMDIPRARRCAYLNLELIERGAWERGAAMSAAMNATPGEGMLYVVNLRGRADKLREHTPALVAEVRQLGIDLVVLDPRYKLIADGEDENSAAGLRGVLQFRDALAEVAAVLMIGHDPKGEVAGKGMADRGAGSYTAGADYDFSFALSPHIDPEYTVLSTSCRYRKSPPDLSIRFDPERQMFEAEPDKPAIVKDGRRADGARAHDPDAKAERTRLRLEGLETAVRGFTATNNLVSKTAFFAYLATIPAGAAFPQSGTGCLRDAVRRLVEKGVIAETPVKVRTERGEVRRKKNGGFLIGAPEKVEAYNKTFEELSL